MNSEAIDETAIDRLRKAGGEALLIGLKNLYLKNTPDKMKAIKDAMQSGDLETLEKTAHVLISSAGHLGGMGVSNLSQQVELAARAGNKDAALSLVPELIEKELEFTEYLRNNVIDI